jgi:hypothetical protein
MEQSMENDKKAAALDPELLLGMTVIIGVMTEKPSLAL